MSNKKVQVHAFVSGKVQGVGYRFWTLKQAQKLNIKGWVRNLNDGRVEAVFLGEKNVVEKMIKLCHSGPRSAEVTDVTTRSETLDDFQNFEIV